MEMRAPDYVLAMTSIADTDEGFDRLACAMEEIDRALTLTGDEEDRAVGAALAESSAGYAKKAQCRKAPETNEGIKKELALPRCSLPMFEACEMKSELVPLGQAAGRIATDFVILYPPDAPLIVPGEEFNMDLVQAILSYRERGFQIIGADDNRVLCVIT
jgi:arginine/lysine/ornithine decarboxylase